MSKYTSINPNTAPKQQSSSFNSNEFAALINVKSSRFAKHEYNPDTNLEPKVAIKWVMGTTKGNTFERTWSTGVLWKDGENAISPDGKKFSMPIKQNSDAWYMLTKVTGDDCGYPAEKLTDDVSVFDNETFFMAQDQNPKASGSSRKLYPKKYHPEGWEAALQEALRRRAEKEAQSAAPVYTPSTNATLQSSYAPPAVVQNTEVQKVAAEALVQILLTNGSTVTRNQIPGKLNSYVEAQQKQTGKPWAEQFRKDVAIALWDINQLTSIVSSNPSLKLEGETISFK